MSVNQVSSRYLSYLFEVVNDAGYSTSRYLTAHNLRRKTLEDPQGRIPYDQFIDIVEEIVRDSRIEALGLRYGRRFHPADHGILGYAFMSSANLRNGLEIFSTYQQILGPIVDVFVHEEADEACYTAEQAQPFPPIVYHFGVEAWLAEATHFFPLFEDGRFAFSLARVVYPKPPYADRYRELLGCDVLFEQPVNELRFPAEVLDIPFSLAEESVAELCAKQCEYMLRQMVARDDTVDKVRRLLLQQPGAAPGLEDIARSICVSGRTLRRRLQASGTTYRNIVTEVRMTLAAEYLRNTGLSMSEIAFFLGYSDVTAFHRSFRKYFGMTPVTYRTADVSAGNRRREHLAARPPT
ncbi:MAG: AraC family transcriptional regulator [Rhodospirillaceae bacterium]|nr:AraC family transcriptional regulator [Rhodospirillaceae bacterium]